MKDNPLVLKFSEDWFNANPFTIFKVKMSSLAYNEGRVLNHFLRPCQYPD